MEVSFQSVILGAVLWGAVSLNLKEMAVLLITCNQYIISCGTHNIWYSGTPLCT